MSAVVHVKVNDLLWHRFLYPLYPLLPELSLAHLSECSLAEEAAGGGEEAGGACAGSLVLLSVSILFVENL